MKQTDTPSRYPTVRLLIRTPEGLVPLNEQSRSLPLPQNPAFDGPPITYGPYLLAVAAYFTNNSFRNLKRLLRAVSITSGSIPDESPKPKAITITSEKHGALYNVSSMVVHFHGLPLEDIGGLESTSGPADSQTGQKWEAEKSATRNREKAHGHTEINVSRAQSGNTVGAFAINTAIFPEQRAFLAVEYRLLRSISTRFPYPVAGLPRPLLSGQSRLQTGQIELPIDLFVAEWFRDHHEFHLCADMPGRHGRHSPLHVWKPEHDDLYLNGTRINELYRSASHILTSYLDTRTFRQIYPWHHAAGDFIVDESVSPVSVKLITARGYRSLLARKSHAADKLLGSLHFFVNLTIRMRMDRIEGTGEPAWAGPLAFCGIIRGFAEAWKDKERENPEVPSTRDIFSFYLDLSLEERLAFAEIAASDGRVEADETEFLTDRLAEHVQHLSAALQEYLVEDRG